MLYFCKFPGWIWWHQLHTSWAVILKGGAQGTPIPGGAVGWGGGSLPWRSVAVWPAAAAHRAWAGGCRQIEKDLLRTMPSNACFANENSTGVPRLRRALRALAWLYPEIGYCQGTGMVSTAGGGGHGGLGAVCRPQGQLSHHPRQQDRKRLEGGVPKGGWGCQILVPP